MKNFRLCNNNMEDWYERKLYNAIDVVREVKKNRFTTFEVEWKTPLTGEYAKLLEFEDGKLVYQNDNFIIPKTLLKLI